MVSLSPDFFIIVYIIAYMQYNLKSTLYMYVNDDLFSYYHELHGSYK